MRWEKWLIDCSIPPVTENAGGGIGWISGDMPTGMVDGMFLTSGIVLLKFGAGATGSSIL